MTRPILKWSGAAAAGFQAQSTLAETQWNLQPGVTRVAQGVYDMHNLMMIIILVIFIGVFGVMFYSIFAHRKSRGHAPARFHENTTVEIIWTIVPLLILIGMAWPATRTLLAMRDSSNPDITIKVTGYQWKWGYDYLKGEGEGLRFLSVMSTPRDQIENRAPKGDHYLLEVDNPLVVPVGRKIRVLTTANDVIHAWFVPALGVKQDNNPGFVRDTWFRADKEGVYRGQCAELCGKDHGFMPIVVEVVSAEKYTAWVADRRQKLAAVADDPAKTWDLAGLVARGEKVYAQHCVACHQPTGQGVKGAFPALDGSKIVNGPKQQQLQLVLGGKAGTAMAAFGPQLSDTEIAAVITYTRNAWGNRVGDMTQPAEVRAQRK